MIRTDIIMWSCCNFSAGPDSRFTHAKEEGEQILKEESWVTSEVKTKCSKAK